MRVLRIDNDSPYQQLVGVGGLGTGIFFALEGDHSLGRLESRPGHLLNVRDYCKLHIIIHYVARLLSARHSGVPFHVLPIGNVGDDPPGRTVLDEMADVGIDTRMVRTVIGKPTLFSVCFQYPDGDGGNITTSNSAAADLTARDVEGAAALFRARGTRSIALAAPEVPMAARRRLLELATDVGALRIASFVGSEIGSASESGMLDLVDIVSLNDSEAAALVKSEFRPGDIEAFGNACQDFLKVHPALSMIVTAGEHGAYVFAEGLWNYCPAPAVSVDSTAGAGDALLGGVIAALAAGAPLVQPRAHHASFGVVETALDLGVLLASLKCLSPHTIHPYANLDTLLQFAQNVKVVFGDRFRECFSDAVPVSR
jgi:ribokinase